MSEKNKVLEHLKDPTGYFVMGVGIFGLSISAAGEDYRSVWLIIHCLLCVMSYIAPFIIYKLEDKQKINSETADEILGIFFRIGVISAIWAFISLIALASTTSSGSSDSSLNGDGKWHTSKSDYGVYRYKKQGNGWAVQYY
ncbi:MAG: hypothetical protein Q4C99_04980 [Clostridia bacterium]|nr:hypothetical protein [Clostridia bacterium]